MSNKKLSIVILKDKLIPKFRIFIKNYWQKDHIFSKKKTVLKWYYFSKIKKSYNFFIAKHNSKIIGVQGFIPLKLFDNKLNDNEIFLAFWRVIKTDSIGLGYLLHKRIINFNKPSFIGVIGINNQLIKFHKWQGFVIKKMKHYVFISPYLKKYKILNIKVTPKKIIKKKNIYKIIKLDKFKLFNKINDKIFYFQTPLKSKRYLFNRYIKNPFYSYNIFLVLFKDKDKSILVTKKIKIKKTSIIKIVDYVGSNSNFRKMNYLFHFLLKKSRSEFIDIYSHGIPEKNISKAGFKKVDSHSKIIVPTHFEPFENKNITINCAYKSANAPAGKVRIFRGDGDGDRPSKN